MAKKISMTQLNARTIDIINVIRANASEEYQSLVPKITTEEDIPRVGEVLYGYPNLANQFISALMNRIALVNVKSATFNNEYAELKKGYLEFGETVEEVFINIAKAREFSAEKAESREFKRTLPDVRSAFHTMNWRVQYPVTIQDEDLRMAFLNANGVTDLIARIVDSIYTAAEYDEYLLFKYLIIKGVTQGKMYPVAVDPSDMKTSAKSFRGVSNQLTFMSTKYNATGVHTTTSKEDQYIFMDASFNAEYDVDVLSSAFNMDKVTFTGHLKLIDNFYEFDNERFKQIMTDTTMIEEVTQDELDMMSGVMAVLVDKEWFQIYDNQNKFTEVYVSSGEYWNYFYNVWKTVSYSPFSNAVVFIDSQNPAIDIANEPEGLKATISSKSTTDEGTSIYVITVTATKGGTDRMKFIQSKANTENGVAVQKYGAYILPKGKTAEITAKLGENSYSAVTTNGGSTAFTLNGATGVGTSFYFKKL